MDPFTIAMFGMSALGGIADASSERKAGKAKMGFIQSQMKGLTNSLAELGDITNQRIGMAKDLFGEQKEELDYGTSNTLYDIQQSGNQLLSRSNMATSGSAEYMTERAREKTMKGYEFQSRDIRNQLGQTLMGIEESAAEERANLGAEMQRLNYEMKMARQQSNKRFLGIF